MDKRFEKRLTNFIEKLPREYRIYLTVNTMPYKELLEEKSTYAFSFGNYELKVIVKEKKPYRL